jgi:peptidoglycan/LPS O-acetylase OafA/YrhL
MDLHSILRHLRRRTSGQDTIRPIDGLRFFAIATVVGFHANICACRAKFPGIADQDLAGRMSDSFLTQVLNRGNVGVPIFFALSGFILGLPFARHQLQGAPKIRLGPYFERRLSRLEVPYIFSLLIVGLGQLASGLGFSFLHFFASALYVHMLVFGTHSTVNPVSWSLEIEVQFYCIAPLLFGVFALKDLRLRFLVYFAITAPSIAMRALFDEQLSGVHLDQSILGYGFYFIVGLVALELYFSGTLATDKPKRYVFDAIGIISMVALLWPADMSKLASALIFPPACIGLFVAAFRGVVLGWFFSNEYVVVLGGTCYSIYLLHYAVMVFLAKAFGASIVLPGPLWLTTFAFLGLLVPLSIAPCLVFFVLIERPCMNRDWHRRLGAQLKSRLRLA